MGHLRRHALVRLGGAVFAEQHDEWTEMRRYIGLDVLARCTPVLTDPSTADTDQEDALPAAITAAQDHPTRSRG